MQARLGVGWGRVQTQKPPHNIDLLQVDVRLEISFSSFGVDLYLQSLPVLLGVLSSCFCFPPLPPSQCWISSDFSFSAVLSVKHSTLKQGLGPSE